MFLGVSMDYEEENNPSPDENNDILVDLEAEAKPKDTDASEDASAPSAEGPQDGEGGKAPGPEEADAPLDAGEQVPQEGDEEEDDEPRFPITIFAIKTSIGHEKMVANGVANRARKKHAEIFSILSPTKLRGYILVEGRKNIDAMQNLIKGLEHVKGIIDGETDMAEIEHFLAPKPLVSGIAVGDIVEIINGPFKGEKARVRQIDESKEEITVELFEAMVSIPVTIRGDHVRVLEKEAE
jgi:transcriptional antiterminator NusG